MLEQLGQLKSHKNGIFSSLHIETQMEMGTIISNYHDYYSYSHEKIVEDVRHNIIL